MKTNQRGFVAPLLLLVIAVLIAGGAYVYQNNSSSIISLIVGTASQENTNQPITNTSIDLKDVRILDLKVGDVLNTWRVESVNVKSDPNGILDRATVAFKGKATVSGKVWFS